MYEKIVIGIFTALILVTAIAFLAVALYPFDYDYNDPNAKYAAFGALIVLFLGACVVWCECDLFYTVYYLMFRPKTLLKTILNILSSLSLLLIGLTVVDFLLDGFIWPGLDGRITTVLLTCNIAFRMIYLLVIAFSSPDEVG